jgi:hypothetical protein
MLSLVAGSVPERNGSNLGLHLWAMVLCGLYSCHAAAELTATGDTCYPDETINDRWLPAPGQTGSPNPGGT